ncbi:DNA repair helicase XPB [Engelhardtia mirabilis]|uniref:DNA 3'-5' helicase n=1 Tax=Engelhardtia mirabilis TaxID=2528011 RepID=A0A518BKU8_9BACT|nr:Type III restriction enzyme, res subunit [Planctomycetes bacterium Pla133]QDV01899.1 Type III restriction enzyme, res subunit [Planctomycetes bacterium Pla86]
MTLLPDNPLIVQSDKSLLLHTVRSVIDADGRAAKDEDGRPLTEEHPRYAAARDTLAKFAELEKSPDYLHSYRITPVSIWNAAALGMTAQDVEDELFEYSCVPIPPTILDEIRSWFGRYGLLRIERLDAEGFQLVSDDPEAVREVLTHRAIAALVQRDDEGRLRLGELERGPLKQALIRIGFPVDDRGGYRDGDPYAIGLRATTRRGTPFQVRDYQSAAAEAFYRGGSVLGGSGVIVLPCGAGKTVVALAAMSLVGTKTLILTSNTVAVRQWREELLDKTALGEDEVGEYTGDQKIVRPVTITTYQMLTWRRSRAGEFEHFDLFRQENWGLVVYDEVHLLPAPIFRVTAELQARRRLGLTATLVREDGKEDEVFCLIGPKRYDVPWKVLEGQGFIATARCVEVRVPLPQEFKPSYEAADARKKFRVASENPDKLRVVEHLIRKHSEGRVLVIGQYIDQLKDLARQLGVPLITGRTPNAERERLYGAFRSGAERILIVSKVGNFAIDLPDANVAIQVSGTFGSRQEEAQRLGRILRPKSDGSAAAFYAVVTLNSRDQEFAQKRQLFLTEQGYSYEIVEAAGAEELAGHGEMT